MSRSAHSHHRHRARYSRELLLPLPLAATRARSLKFHACLTTVRKGFGSTEHLVELASVMYVSWFLQRAGYGDLPLEEFHAAEQYMEIANRRGALENLWCLDKDGYPFFEHILQLHDRQLDTAPAYAIVQAEGNLRDFINGTASSPLPPLTSAQGGGATRTP